MPKLSCRFPFLHIFLPISTSLCTSQISNDITTLEEPTLYGRTYLYLPIATMHLELSALGNKVITEARDIKRLKRFFDGWLAFTNTTRSFQTSGLPRSPFCHPWVLGKYECSSPLLIGCFLTSARLCDSDDKMQLCSPAKLASYPA